MRIDDGRDSGISCTHQRQPLLDGADPSDLEMLIRACAAAVPTVVGDVQKPGGRRRFGRHRTRKDHLVADQGADGRRTGQIYGPGARARAEIDRPGGDLGEAEPVPERDVFTERHEVELVIRGDDLAPGIDGQNAVPDADVSTPAPHDPRRPGDYRTARERKSTHRPDDFRPGVEEEWKDRKSRG